MEKVMYDLNALDAKGWGLIHHAAYDNAESVVVWLCEAGADVNLGTISSVGGETALHIAGACGQHGCGRDVGRGVWCGGGRGGFGGLVAVMGCGSEPET